MYYIPDRGAVMRGNYITLFQSWSEVEVLYEPDRGAVDAVAWIRVSSWSEVEVLYVPDRGAVDAVAWIGVSSLDNCLLYVSAY